MMVALALWLAGETGVASPGSPAASSTSTAPAASTDTTPIACPSCDAWNAPEAPFVIHGRTFYVGVNGLSAILIETPAGLVLLDGGLPQSAPLIAANIARLGFPLTAVKWILVSHVHNDHVGGVAALQRLSGAQVGSSKKGAEALRQGRLPADDPQVDFGAATTAFPPVPTAQAVNAVSLGGVTVLRHDTPGHTPGGSTWTWRSCPVPTGTVSLTGPPAGRTAACVDVVYADSLNPVSAPSFRFTAHPATAAALRASAATIAALRCDVLLAPHPGFADLFAKRDRMKTEAQAGGCRAYAAAAITRLQQRLADEAAAAKDKPSGSP